VIGNKCANATISHPVNETVDNPTTSPHPWATVVQIGLRKGVTSMNTSNPPSALATLRPGWAAVVTAALLSIVTACSTADPSQQTVGSSGGSSFMSQAQISELQSLVEKASAVPKFVPPGPAFDTSKLKGKRIFAIPTASQLPVCNQIANDVVRLAGKVGMTGTNFQNSGGPAGWIPGIQQAISQRYDAIVLVCGIDPNLIKPQLQAAKNAGIAVIDSGLYDSYGGRGEQTSPLVTAQTNLNNGVDMQRSIDVMLLENRAKPFDIFLITSNDVPNGVIMARAIRDEVAKYCEQCKISTTDVPVPDWGTKIQSVVNSALLRNPKIKAVIPIFDGEVPPAAAAIRASGRTDVKLYGCYGGTPEYVLQMGKGLPMGSNVGPTALWRAYAAMDQTLRVLSGAGAVSPIKNSDPNRVFTIKNYTEAGKPNNGFGTEFITGYEKLWGISGR
jgi:ribose transport system substrate-binding protein